MDAETLAALRASIQHWRENVEAETPENASIDAYDCALCKKFASGFTDACLGCPVFERTGTELCGGTPYKEAFHAWCDWEIGIATREKWRSAAQAELDFLISLLPEGEKP